MSLFELSRNFFPEAYSDHQRLPPHSFVIIRSYEQRIFPEFKVNLYRLLYLRSPRRWCRLNIAITIARSSRYWAATKTSQQQYNPRETIYLGSSAALPYSLHTTLQGSLQGKDFDEDGILRFSLIDNKIMEQECQIRVCSLATIGLPSSNDAGALAFLDDLGCPRYYENEITQIEVHDPPNGFVSCFKGTLVYEIKSACPSPSAELLYNIRVLHRMAGRSSFPEIVGVIVDRTGRYLKSYFFEFPMARRSLDHTLGSHCIPWERREKWAKQLIEGISQINSQGFVVGTLFSGRSPLLVDDADSLLFWHFRSSFHAGSIGTSYPPEFCLDTAHSHRIMKEDKCLKLTSKTDIFHLGALLWLIAENSTMNNASPACIRERCNEQGCRDKSHWNPILLPKLPESIPKYYREMVDACRARDPSNRPAAWRLLKLFPLLLSESTPLPELRNQGHLNTRNVDLSVMGGSLMGMVNCDLCRKRNLQLPFFHCNVCETGYFDLCWECYESGVHCEDNDHLLVEIVKVGNLIRPGRYHSSVRSTGKREVIKI